MNITKDYLFYMSQGGLKKLDFNTNESVKIYGTDVENLEVVGDKLLVTSSSGQRIIMNFDGTNQSRPFVSMDGSYI